MEEQIAQIRVDKDEPILLFSVDKHYYWKCDDLAIETELNGILKQMFNNPAKVAHLFGPDVPSIGQNLASYCIVTLGRGELLSYKKREKKVDYVSR